MSAAPIGLRHPVNQNALRRDAAISAVVTHANPMAVASTVTQAAAVAWCIHRPPDTLDPVELVDAIVLVLDGVHDPDHPEQRPGAAPGPVRLVDRIAELPGLLELRPEEAYARHYNGAFVLESLPAALWCFLRQPEDPEAVMIRHRGERREGRRHGRGYGRSTGRRLPRRVRSARPLDIRPRVRRRASSPRRWALSAARATARDVRTGMARAGASESPDDLDRFRGCVLGGAGGDAQYQPKRS